MEENNELEALIIQNQKQGDETNTLLESSVMLQKEIVDSLKGVQKIEIKGDKGDKGDRGEDGKTPVKGEDYFTDEEVVAFLKAVTPIKGKDYNDGKDGKDGIDGKDGKDADETKIVEKIIAKLPNQEKKFGAKIDNLKKELEAKIPDFKPAAQSIPVKVNGVEVAGKLESINITGSGLAVSADKWGNISISANTPVSVDLSDQCDGSNKIFTLPSFTSVLMLSGSSFPFIYKPTTDFTVLSSTQIELTSEVSAPEAGQTLIAIVI